MSSWFLFQSINHLPTYRLVSSKLVQNKYVQIKNENNNLEKYNIAIYV